MRILLIIIACILMVSALRLLLLKRDIGAYHAYWAKRAQEKLPADSVLYVALGDSAAQAIGASRPQKGYVGLIADNLAKTSGSSVHIINLSVSGAKIKDVLDKQLPQLQQLNLPTGTVVTIEIGANDMANFKEARFRSEMDRLLGQLPPQTVVADVPYFGGSWARGREPDAVKGAAIIQELVKTHNLRQAYLHDITKEKDKPFGYAADLFHPNDRGYRNWFKAFEQALNN